MRKAVTELTLPWPPTVNTYWRSIVIGGRVRLLMSKKGRMYREAVVAAMSVAKPFTERLEVHLSCFPPDRRKRDLDNLPKGILDALQHAGVYVDDSQIDWLSIERMPIQKGGSVTVRITRLEP